MKKIRIKRILYMIVSIFLVCGIVLFIQYMRPKRYDWEGLLCTQEGEKVKAIFHVTQHNHVFKPSGLTGEIILDGVTYKSSSNIGFGTKKDPAWSFFVPKENIKNFFLMKKLNNKYIMIIIKEKVYFGPATNKSEVDNILSE